MAQAVRHDVLRVPADEKQAKQARIAFRLGVASAIVCLVCILLLIGDHIVTVGRAPADKSRVEALEAGVKTDAGVAETLHTEREQQTNVSLARKTRRRVLAWVLLVAGGVFVASGKRFISLQPQPLPSLDELVAVRFAPAAPVGGKPPKALPVVTPAGESTIDLSFVDDLVARVGRSQEVAIPILQAIQSHYRYLPDEALARVCELTEITPSQIAGTSSFYAQFRRSPVGRYVVRLCHGTACHVAGVEQINQELRRHLQIPPGEDTDPRRLFTIDPVACLGCCSLAPVMMIDEETAGHLTPAGARQALDAVASRT
jgi:NADH:ubiquinone oxidoreductase subunit E